LASEKMVSLIEKLDDIDQNALFCTAENVSYFIRNDCANNAS